MWIVSQDGPVDNVDNYAVFAFDMAIYDWLSTKKCIHTPAKIFILEILLSHLFNIFYNRISTIQF